MVGTSLFERVDQVWVINLPKRTDRRSQVVAELERHAGSAVVLDRVEIFPAVTATDAGNFASPGIRGCFESHLAVLRAAQEAGHERVLVVEDDLAFNAQAVAALPVVADLLDGCSWDMVSLGVLHPEGFTFGPDDHQRTVTAAYDGWTAPTDDAGEIVAGSADGVHLRRYRGGHIGAHCMLYNGAVLPSLIAHLERCAAGTPGDHLFGPIPVDGAFNTFAWTHDVERLVVWPTLAGQRSSRSDITPGRFDRITALRPLLDSVRARRT